MKKILFFCFVIILIQRNVRASSPAASASKTPHGLSSVAALVQNPAGAINGAAAASSLTPKSNATESDQTEKGLAEFGGLTRSQMVQITREVEKRAPKPADYFEKNPTKDILADIEKKRVKEINELLDAHSMTPKTKSRTVRAIVGVMLDSDIEDYDFYGLGGSYR